MMRGEFHNMDCLEGIKKFPDNHFDLAIVDPPYGIGSPNHEPKTSPLYKGKTWNNHTPGVEYWERLLRVSKNQIVWGANYYCHHLSQKRGWIVWDKKISGAPAGFSRVELAWTSFIPLGDDIARVACREREKIHPTQKPVALYKWLLDKYAKEGDLILDTHVGSASSLIACEDMDFDYVGYELDSDYYEAAMKRIKQHISQLKMFA